MTSPSIPPLVSVPGHTDCMSPQKKASQCNSCSSFAKIDYEHAPQRRPGPPPASSEKDFLSRFDTFARRSIPEIVEQESGAVDPEDPAIERSEMTDLVLRVHSRLMRMYSQQCQARSPTRDLEDPAPPAAADTNGTDPDGRGHDHVDVLSEQTCRDNTNLDDTVDWSIFDFSTVENHESSHEIAGPHHSIDDLPFDYFVDLGGPSRGLQLESEPTAVDDSGYISGAFNAEDPKSRQEPDKKKQPGVENWGLYI